MTSMSDFARGPPGCCSLPTDRRFPLAVEYCAGVAVRLLPEEEPVVLVQRTAQLPSPGLGRTTSNG